MGFWRFWSWYWINCLNRICIKPLNSIHCHRHHVYIAISTECDYKFLPRVEKGKCYRIISYQMVVLSIHVKFRYIVSNDVPITTECKWSNAIYHSLLIKDILMHSHAFFLFLSVYCCILSKPSFGYMVVLPFYLFRRKNNVSIGQWRFKVSIDRD